ncbi:hypothetical protein JHK82_012195 [Glycine max]|nr:hypothetical protein JHK85_012535 [Glycine max]KAG5154226.1 hypothetical protein JHK82_012195 [Glycine max]
MASKFYNEKFAVQVAEIGVSVGAEIAVHLGQEDKPSFKGQINFSTKPPSTASPTLFLEHPDPSHPPPILPHFRHQ